MARTDDLMEDVLLTAIEAIRVAEGHPVNVRTAAGTEVTVRLPSFDEAVQIHERALASMKEEFGVDLPRSDDLTLMAACQPVKLEAVR